MDANVYRHNILLAGLVKPLKKRSDFLYIKSGLKVKSRGFLLTAKQRKIDSNISPNLARLGFTVTKKCGNAVVRNRIKRRLREASRLGLCFYLLAKHDYNIIGYTSSLDICFQNLIEYLQLAAIQYNNQINSDKK